MDVIQCYNYGEVQGVETGHSRDHVCYHEAVSGWLFSGDLFLEPCIRYFRSNESVLDTIASTTARSPER